MKTRIIKLVTAVLVLSLAVTPVVPGVSAPLNLSVAAEDNDSNNTYYDDTAAPKTAISAEGVAKANTSEIYSYKSIQSALKKYSAKNSDVKGWLVVPNTNINKPIAFSPKANDYYVNRTIEGVNYPDNSYPNFVETASYLDCRTIFASTWRKSSRNTVIYGHNWTNLRIPHDVGSNNSHLMFAQLPSYTDINFAKQNPHLYYSTAENEGIWRVFSVAFVELSSTFEYNNPNPGLENGEFEKLLKELKARSVYNFGVDVNSKDRIITLSTCTRQYDVGGNQRFIVVARLLREGESEKDTVTVVRNNDVKEPQFQNIGA